MSHTIQVNPAAMDVEETQCKTVFQETFRPIFLLLKISGLCPKIPSKSSGSKRLKVLSVLYSVFVVIMNMFHIARAAPYLNITSSFDLYLRINVMVWYLRNLAFSIYIIRIASFSDERASRLGYIIKRLDENIDDAQLRSRQKSIKNFKIRTRIMIWFIGTLILMSALFVCIAIAAQFGSGVIADSLLRPFHKSLAFKIIYSLANIYLVVAWLAPQLLYSTMCSSLVLKLSFLKSRVVSLSESSSLQRHIRAVRCMFLDVTSIVTKADDVFGLAALLIYFFDIVLFSVTLYGSLFIAKAVIEHVNLWFWCFVAFLNLLLISIDAARVEEKVNFFNVLCRVFSLPFSEMILSLANGRYMISLPGPLDPTL